jgi:hypothetical protein
MAPATRSVDGLVGFQLGKQLKPFGTKVGSMETDARQVAARPGETGDEALCDGVVSSLDVAGFAQSLTECGHT